MTFTASWPVLVQIQEATRERPVTIATIQAATGLSPRAIKAVVERMRREGIAIGASRGKVAGYYCVRSVADAEAAIAPLVRQLSEMAKTVRAMVPESRYRELVGQAVLEVEK